ncbi:hypothetical protein RvY_04853 [Ramazzottius varieornatus]|uniref:Mini-chromosome maintenance complex-binding protein n=1 Tax=Ramazzottius varieornatus TaxID=947166 RepID=A0A1D1UW96_RAMVA|nr:hypothetical protein RvY_04853 [Ramazzottius varieornatus]
MPAPSTPKWALDPLTVVDGIFASDTARFRDDPESLRTEVERFFQERLRSSTFDYRYLVPSINGLSKDEVQALSPNILVRFRCMVQDEKQMSYHQPMLHIRNEVSGDTHYVCSIFKISVPVLENETVVGLGDPSSLREMRSVSCVPLPAEAKWVCSLNDEMQQKTRLFGSLLAEDKENAVGANITVIANLFAGAGSAIGINDSIELFGTLQKSTADITGDVDGEAVPARDEKSMEIRMSVLVYEELSHAHPALPLAKADLSLLAATEQSIDSTRKLLFDRLLRCLRGDELSTQYILMYLLSSTYSWTADMAIGNFSLNVIDIPEDALFLSRLLSQVEDVVTQLRTFGLTVANLNSSRMAPLIKERQTDMEHDLQPGFLQLPKHTHLVLDELGMTTGTLNDAGVRNVMALQRLAKDQELLFDYEFGVQAAFRMDIPLLVLSQGRSLVECRYVVPLASNVLTGADFRDLDTLSEKDMWRIRQYLVMAKFAEYEIATGLRQAIVEEFVETRKSDRSLSGEQLHNQLELARYLCISHGEKTLTKERWEEAVGMEKTRQARLKDLAASR